MGEGPTAVLLPQMFEVDPLACPTSAPARHTRPTPMRGAPHRRGPARAEVRHKPPRVVAGLAVAASSIVRAILEVLLSLLFALWSGTR
jgi:hypothetical protein